MKNAIEKLGILNDQWGREEEGGDVCGISTLAMITVVLHCMSFHMIKNCFVSEHLLLT